MIRSLMSQMDEMFKEFVNMDIESLPNMKVAKYLIDKLIVLGFSKDTAQFVVSNIEINVCEEAWNNTEVMQSIMDNYARFCAKMVNQTQVLYGEHWKNALQKGSLSFKLSA